MPRRLHLTDDEVKFAFAYIQNGFKAYAAAIEIGWDPETARSSSYRVPNRPQVQQYIQEKLMEIERDALRRREKILDHLQHGMVTSIPLEVDIIEPECIKAGIACIQEMNKMDGNYAVVKTDAVQVDVSVKEVIETTAEEKKKYDKSY